MSQKKQFEKVTRGTLYLFLDGDGKKRRRIKPNQIVTATEDQLGDFASHFVEIPNPTEAQKQAPNMQAAQEPKRTRKRTNAGQEEETSQTANEENEGYKLDPTGGGWYNVLSPEGKIVNESKLREDDALALVDSLTTSGSEE